MPSNIPVISSTKKNIGNFDYRIILAHEIEYGSLSEESVYRSRYAKDLIDLVNPEIITTDSIRYILHAVRRLKPGQTLDEEELASIRDYLRAQSEEAEVRTLDRTMLETDPAKLGRMAAANLSLEVPGAFSGMIYAERNTAKGRQEQQLLTFFRNEEDRLIEFAQGEVNETFLLNTVPPSTDIIGNILPPSAIVATLEKSNPHWRECENAQSIRTISLLGSTSFRFASGVPAFYVAVCLSQNTASVMAINATTGVVFASSLVPILFPTIFASGWSTAINVIGKLCTIYGLIQLMIATGGAAIGTAPTVVVALLLALALMLEIAAAIYMLIQVLTELTGPEDPRVKKLMKKYNALRKSIDETQKALEQGKLDKKQAADKLKETGKTMKEVGEELEKALKGEDGGDDAGGLIDDLQDILNAVLDLIGKRV